MDGDEAGSCTSIISDLLSIEGSVVICFCMPVQNWGEGGGNILWSWKIQKGKLVQIVRNLNKERINDNTKLMAPVDTQKITVRPLYLLTFSVPC